MKSDIRAELLSLKTLEGAAFGIKLKEIAARKEFRALPDNPFIYSVGGDQDADYPSLLMAARKAVEHGYRVFMLPNPPGVKTPDYILERRGVYKLFDLKNISGKNIVLTIFRRKYELSIFRRFALSARFYTEFKKLYEK